MSLFLCQNTSSDSSKAFTIISQFLKLATFETPHQPSLSLHDSCYSPPPMLQGEESQNSLNSLPFLVSEPEEILLMLEISFYFSFPIRILEVTLDAISSRKSSLSCPFYSTFQGSMCILVLCSGLVSHSTVSSR